MRSRTPGGAAPGAEIRVPQWTAGRAGTAGEPRPRRAVVGDVGGPGRIVIVANRLPVTVVAGPDGRRVVPSSGGLATGLRDVHDGARGVWVGWTGEARGPDTPADPRIEAALAAVGACAVPLDADDVAGYYDGFANGVLWPLLHGRPELARHSELAWERYCAINERFARHAARHLRPGDRVWVHDYHLMLVPRLLRRLCPGTRIGFFLHTPMTASAGLDLLPFRQRAALLDGMLGADLVGLHTPADADRFAAATRDTLGRDPMPAGSSSGVGAYPNVGAFPMGIDAAGFEARARGPEVDAEVGRLRAAGGPLFVGVDRLDYTKGLPERLDAFARLLERSPELVGRARLIQLAVPSREDVPEYRALRERVERRVERINGRFGRGGWTPVEYVYGTVTPSGLAALYRAADVMLVTPLRDGMNLVAKEFVASRVDEEGVLVLSVHAGAATQLRAAVACDPRDVDALAAAYGDALAMGAAERRVRMRRMRANVLRHDVAWWATTFLAALDGRAAGGGVPRRVGATP